jgi:hypothetical protein
MNSRILILAVALGAVRFQSSPSVSAQASPNTLRNFRYAAEGHAIIVGQALVPSSGWAFVRTEQ